MALNELGEFPSHLPYFVLSDYWLFPELRRMPEGKIFGSFDEIIAGTEVENDKLLKNKGVGMLEKHWADWITLEKNCV